MMKGIALVLLFLALAVSGRSLLDDGSVADVASEVSGDGHGRPESPEYKVINKTVVYELREYKNATWAISFGRSRFLTDIAAFKAGLGLAKYFSGANAAHARIGRTVPVIGTILRPHPPHPPKNGSRPEPPHGKNGSHPGHGKHHHHHHHHPPGPPTVAVAAYIPKKFEGDVPPPDCPHVKILHTNTSEVYTHRFGGWAISWVIRREIGHLAHALKEEGICAFKGKFLVASYDGPWKIFGRHNEIWWVKRPKHHNDTDTSVVPGLEAFDVEDVFPEEFEEPEEPEPLADGWPEAVQPAAVVGEGWAGTEEEAAAFDPFAEPGRLEGLAADGYPGVMTGTMEVA